MEKKVSYETPEVKAVRFLEADIVTASSVSSNVFNADGYDGNFWE